MTSPDENTVVISSELSKGTPVNSTLHRDELPAGTRLGEFEIRSVLGVGGFSIVYLATDHSLKRTVALKEYMPSTIAIRSEEGTICVRTESQKETFMVGLKSFLNEAQLLARFDHPALVKVYRFWEANNTAYMVMPNYDGVTLKEFLRQRVHQHDEQWIKSLLRPLLGALAVMHKDDCYHRDIAPDNIILKHDTQQPVLLDLGAARRIINEMTQMLTVILKPGYAPVEQYADAPGMKQGPWTDIYALGALVHFLIIGKIPPVSVSRLLKDSYVPLSQVVAEHYSEDFLSAIDTALAIRPEERPQSVEELADLLGIDLAITTPGYTEMDTGADRSMRTIARTESRRANGQFEYSSSRSSTKTAKTNTVNRLTWAIMVGLSVAVLTVGLLAMFKPQLAPSEDVKPQLGAYTTANELIRIAALAAPDIHVTVALQSAVVKIGKDYLKFSISSDHDGYVYVFMLDAEGKQYRLLFPNDYDMENRIVAGQTLALPNASWPMVAGAPAGTTRFLVMVSKEPREFISAGATSYSIFKVFSPMAQAKNAAKRTPMYSPLAGEPLCGPENLSCDRKYGAVTFDILSVEE